LNINAPGKSANRSGILARNPALPALRAKAVLYHSNLHI
jgi:hypothetical protein